jgi:hypothetical protein
MLPTAQRYSDSALGGSSRSGSTGSVDVPEAALRRRCAISVTCTGGTATFTLKGAAGGSVLGAIASSGATSSSWAYVTEAPWAALELSWASNTGTVAVEVMTWD